MARPFGTKKIESPERMWELFEKKTSCGNYVVIPPKKGYSGITITNKRKNPNGCIYFIKADGLPFYKLGVSSNPKRRICDIDSYMPFDISILSLHRLENVYEVESEISKHLKPFKIRREWYKLSIEQAKDIMIDLHNINVRQDAKTD